MLDAARTRFDAVNQELSCPIDRTVTKSTDLGEITWHRKMASTANETYVAGELNDFGCFSECASNCYY